MRQPRRWLLADGGENKKKTKKKNIAARSETNDTLLFYAQRILYEAQHKGTRRRVYNCLDDHNNIRLGYCTTLVTMRAS